MNRPHERILGTVLVVLGVALLLFTFYHAYGLLGHLPSASSDKGPNAAFSWTVSGFLLTVTDNSRPGSSAISSSYWSFADGNSTSTANTSHTYSRAGNYNVSLMVEDKNGFVAESAAIVHVGTGASGTGTGSPSLAPGGSIQSTIGNSIGGTLSGVLTSVETFSLLVVMWLVGGSLLKAGWNLITPKAETIQVRVKPKSWEAEGVGYSAMTPSGTPAAAPASPAIGALGDPASSAAAAGGR